MGTAYSFFGSPCCGVNSTPEPVQTDIRNEARSNSIRYNQIQTTDKQIIQEKIELKNLTEFQSAPQAYENEIINYKIQRKKIALRLSQSADVYMPSPMSISNVRQAQSFSASLSVKHKYQLNLKRKNSILIRRSKKDFTLPFRINQICTKFLNYIIENDLISDSDKEIDLFDIEISYSQFNIVLNNNEIEISPDMIASLIWELLDINNMIESELKYMGLEKDNLHNNPMRERSFHQKQFKLISKCKITYNMIKYLMEQLNNNKIISSWDKIAQPQNLTYKQRNFVIWDKIFKNLLNNTPFNVENDYLYGVLNEEDMNNLHKIIDMLSSLQSHWKHRIQIMKYIDNKISCDAYENDTFDNKILHAMDNDIFIKLLNGWSIQLSSDRSAVSWPAIALLPTVLTSLLLSIPYPIILFDKQNIMNPMFDGIFILIKNKRLKHLAEDAHESFIQIIDIFTEIATDLEDYELLKMVIEILNEHSNHSIEKHFAVREACIGGIGFVLFGVDNENVKANYLEAINENEDDIKLENKINEKVAAKLSVVMQRNDLLKNNEFIGSLGDILKNGITDKNELCRKKSFELIQRLDNDLNGNLLGEISVNWDFIVTKKYNTYKRMQQRKHEKKKSYKRVQKKGKKKKKKKDEENKDKETSTIEHEEP